MLMQVLSFLGSMIHTKNVSYVLHRKWDLWCHFSQNLLPERGQVHQNLSIHYNTTILLSLRDYRVQAPKTGQCKPTQANCRICKTGKISLFLWTQWQHELWVHEPWVSCLWRSCIFGLLAWCVVLAVEAEVNILVSSVHICLEIVKSNVSLNFESKHSFWSFWLASNHKQGDSQSMFWTMWTYSIRIRLVCCFFKDFKQVEITHFSLVVENLNS